MFNKIKLNTKQKNLTVYRNDYKCQKMRQREFVNSSWFSII